MLEINQQQPFGNCHECAAMWREYSDATADHLRLLLELEMAAASRDHFIEDQIYVLIPTAEKRRTEARQIIRIHEAAHLTMSWSRNGVRGT